MDKSFDILNDKALCVWNDTEPCVVKYNGETIKHLSAIKKNVESETSVTYESEYKKNLLELDVEGNTYQKQLQGKNLFDISQGEYSGVATIVEKTQSSIIVSATGTYKSANFVIPNWQNLLGKKITYSCNISNITNPNAITRLAIRFFNGSSGVYNSNTLQSTYNVHLEGDVSVTGIINAPSDNFEQYPDAQLCVALYSNANGETGSEVSTVTYSNIQIEYGDKPTEYEEYCGGIPSPNPTYPQEIQNADNMSVELSGDFEPKIVQIPSEITVNGTVVPLMFSKIGVSADKLVVDNISKKVIYKKQNHHREFTGNENWVYHATQQQGGYNNVWYRLDELTPQGNTSGSVNPQGITVGYGLSNMLYFSFETSAPMKTGWLFRFANNNGKRLYVITPPEAELDTIDKFKAFLQEKYASGSPLTIQYVAIPKEYDLTNTDLGRELLALASETQNATNVITITSSIPTSKLSVDYAEWGGRNDKN